MCIVVVLKNVKCNSRVFRAHPSILSLEHKCHSLPYSSYVVEEVSLNQIKQWEVNVFIHLWTETRHFECHSGIVFMKPV